MLTGEWQTDPVHGAQFRPREAVVRAPSEPDDIVRYLGSGLIRNVGPVLAQRIVAAFGAQTLEVLDNQPEQVRHVAGIGPQRGAGTGSGVVGTSGIAGCFSVFVRSWRGYALCATAGSGVWGRCTTGIECQPISSGGRRQRVRVSHRQIDLGRICTCGPRHR